MDAQQTLHRAVAITLNRAEGPTSSCRRPVRCDGDNPWQQARTQLATWSVTAPSDGSANKVDFTVDYDDGTDYTGCFGLKADDVDLPGHITGYLDFVAAHPREHEPYVDLEEVATFRDRYEIGRR